VPDCIGQELNRDCPSPPLLIDGLFELGSIRSAHRLMQIQGVWIGSGLCRDMVHLQLLQKQIFLIKLWVYCFVDDSFSQLLLGFGEPLGQSYGAPGSSSNNELLCHWGCLHVLHALIHSFRSDCLISIYVVGISWWQRNWNN
jgi:hypothetical protein